MNHRYYVQRLTKQIFLVRERLVAHEAPGADDRIIRSFHIPHDASLSAHQMNHTPDAHQQAGMPQRDTHAEKPIPLA